MSGIEVVGILLGAFPLVISAFEHYRDIAKAANLLANWEAENLNSLGEIKDEEVSFRLNMALLLLPLVNEEVIAEDDLETLLQNPGGAAWQQADVEQALRDRLGDITERYICLMQELQGSMIKLLQSLGFDRPKFQKKLAKAQSGPRSISDLAVLANAQLLKRVDQIKFGIGKAARDEALAEVRTKNDKLRKLLRQCDQVAALQPAETRPTLRKASRALLQYWQHAGRIYALCQGSLVCSCKTKHCAHIWLHHPSTNANELKLLVFWGPQTGHSGGAALWTPQDLQISWIQSQAMRKSLQVATPTSITPKSSGQGASQAGNIFRRAKKRVKFDVPGDAGPDICPNITPATEGKLSESAKGVVLAKTPADQRDGLIRDLCKAMSSCGMTPQQLGALSESGDGLQYIVCSQPNARVAPTAVSLYDILHHWQGKPLRKRSDRFRIALAVASAHLQLRSTPWARRQWESKDILFPKESGGPNQIKFEPYISADFNDDLSAQAKQPKQTDRSFAGLGVMLLELCFGVVLDEHEFWSKPGMAQNQTDPYFRNMVAIQWANDVEGDAGPNFAAAVEWCLRESPMTLDGNQWRKDLADQVVMPLQHCWDHIKPRTAT